MGETRARLVARLVARRAAGRLATAVLAGVWLSSAAAWAQDGTWLAAPGSNDMTVGANWSTGSVPTGTSTFGASNTTSLTTTGFWSQRSLQFNAGAPAYTVTLSGVFQLTGAGIVNLSSNAPTFIRLAGSDGNLIFRNASTAGNAVLISNTSGFTDAFEFLEQSSAANATIALAGGSVVNFANNSTAGNATVTMTGAFTRLWFHNSSTAGNATITVGNGSSLSFFDSSTGGLARLIVNAGGTLDLTSLTAPGLTAGSIEGDGAFALAGRQLTVGGNNLSTTAGGVISGVGGSLVKVGSGTLTLTGANSYTGGTFVNAGRLSVNGSVAGDVTVGSGGILGGTGIIGGNVVVNGTIAPGNSIGTLNVTGNVTQAAGSTYQAEVNAAGQSDLLNVTGAARLNGGTVQMVPASGVYARNTTYTILSATGGVTGTYGAVASNYAFLSPALSYDINNVYLTLSVAFARGAQTPNQGSVGAVLDQSYGAVSGDFAAVVNAIAGSSTAQGPAVLNAISGQPYADLGTANIASGIAFMNTLGLQVAGTRGGAGGGPRVALAQACDVACDAADAPRLAAWISGLGGVGTVGGNGNAGSFTYNFGGSAIGADYRVDQNFLVGLAVGYTTGQQWVGGFQGNGNTENYSAALYGSFTQGAFYTDALAGYAYSDNQMRRSIQIPGLAARVANGRTGANQFLGQVETGYRFDIYTPAQASLTPFARLQTMAVSQNGFTENGADSLDLSVAAQNTTSVRTVLGATLAGIIPVGDHAVTTSLRLGWAHEHADTARPMTAAFAGAPTSAFTVQGAQSLRDAAVIGFGFNTQIAAATSLYARYDGEITGRDDAHAFSAGLRMTW